MKRFLPILKGVLAVVCLLGLAGCGDDNSADRHPLVVTRAEQQVAADLTEFSWNLLRETHKMKMQTYPMGANTIISPFSAAATLGMAANASDGETRAKLIDVLGLDNGDLSVFDELVLKALTDLPLSDKKVKFKTANSLWLLQPYLKATPEYAALLGDFYQAPIKSIPSNKDGSDQINSWAKNAMGKAFGNLDLAASPTTQSIWVNLLTFDGEWSHKFDKSKTKKESFKTFLGSSTKVEMMNAEGKFKRFCYFTLPDPDDLGSYAPDKEYAGVTLDYGNGTFGFTAVIPMGGKSFSWLLDNLTADNIKEICSKKEYNPNSGEPILLKLPKFEVHDNVNLAPVINEMAGENLMDNLSFPAINGNAGPSSLSQEATIKLDEEGTKVKVKTVKEKGLTSVGKNYLYFDEPFIYFIFHQETGLILTAGTFGR